MKPSFPLVLGYSYLSNWHCFNHLLNAALAFKSSVLRRLFWFPQCGWLAVCLGFVCPSAALPEPDPAMRLGIHALVGVLSFNFHASFIACCGDFIK